MPRIVWLSWGSEKLHPATSSLSDVAASWYALVHQIGDGYQVCGGDTRMVNLFDFPHQVSKDFGLCECCLQCFFDPPGKKTYLISSFCLLLWCLLCWKWASRRRTGGHALGTSQPLVMSIVICLVFRIGYVSRVSHMGFGNTRLRRHDIVSLGKLNSHMVWTSTCTVPAR